MNDLAEDFMAPVRAREQRLADLNRQIVEKEKELAALEGECAVARKAMNDLGDQRVALQVAVNSNRALLSQSQSDLAATQALFDALRKKVASLPTRMAG
jgi:predicted  nucleic acid-binding Zn-ribbon protein